MKAKIELAILSLLDKALVGTGVNRNYVFNVIEPAVNLAVKNQHVATKRAMLNTLKSRFDDNELVPIGRVIGLLSSVTFDEVKDE